MPFTSMTSSPQDMRPDLSAAPPCITRAIKMRPVPSSALMVAPYSKWYRLIHLLLFIVGLELMVQLYKTVMRNVRFYLKEKEKVNDNLM